ncbi:hypothetical protein AB0F96_31800 [Streptomyces sp. NPDC023998]|uniref:hypothetical protein n=1 Tax=Streptomyces sp. NPDC023998 TaxID=3154597 RepID=UPI00340767B5
MSDVIGLHVQVQSLPDGDPEELAEFTGRLRAELLDLDVMAVDPVRDPAEPAQAKGLATVVGWLAIQLRTAEGLRAVVNAVRGWAGRTDRVVEISLGGDTLKVTGATSAQQELLISAWLARHAADT